MLYWLINFADVSVTVQAESKKAQALIGKVLVSIPTKLTNNAEEVCLRLEYENGTWFFSEYSGQSQKEFDSEVDVACHFMARVGTHIVRKASTMHCLHAASVSKDGKGVIICGGGGSGKSTLAACLVSRGFDYMGDELVALNDQGQLWALAQSMQVKSYGVEAISPLIIHQETVQHGEMFSTLPLSSINGNLANACQDLGLFIFPRYEPDSGYSFERISSANAGMRVMTSYLNIDNTRESGFRGMMSLVRNTPCYELTYGGFDQLPQEFFSFFETI